MRSDDMFEVRLLKRPHKFFVYWIGRLGQTETQVSEWTKDLVVSK